MIVVMGIDPGFANTGFGVVRVAGSTMRAVDAGVIESQADLAPEARLRTIHDALAELIAWHEPEAVALEDLYFGRNVRSAIGVGQARGVRGRATAAFTDVRSASSSTTTSTPTTTRVRSSSPAASWSRIASSRPWARSGRSRSSSFGPT